MPASTPRPFGACVVPSLCCGTTHLRCQWRGFSGALRRCVGHHCRLSIRCVVVFVDCCVFVAALPAGLFTPTVLQTSRCAFFFCVLDCRARSTFAGHRHGGTPLTATTSAYLYGRGGTEHGVVVERAPGSVASAHACHHHRMI